MGTEVESLADDGISDVNTIDTAFANLVEAVETEEVNCDKEIERLNALRLKRLQEIELLNKDLDAEQ